MVPAVGTVYLVVCLLLLAGAALVHAVAPLPAAVPVAGLLVPLGMLWVLLPALGGGGADAWPATAWTPYPVSPRLLLVSGWLAAVLDLSYLLPVPILAAVAVATAGPAALLPLAAFTLGCSALGQLLAWATVAGLQTRRGTSLAAGAVLAAVLMVLWVLVPRPGGLSALLPAARVHAALAAPADLPRLLAWGARSLLPAVPVPALLAAGPRLVSRASCARAGNDGMRRRRRRAGPLPAHRVGAVYLVGLRGLYRAWAFKAALMTGAAVPLVAASGLPGLDVQTLGAFSLLSTSATLAANTWAYDAGGTSLVLAAPVARRELLAARAGVVATGLAVVVAVAVALGAALGMPVRAGWVATSGHLLVLLVLVTAVGLRTATRRPSAADVDSLRGRPTSLPSAVGCTVRAGALVGLLSLLGALPGPGPLLAAAVVVGYLAWAAWATAHDLGDGARLLSAFPDSG